MINPISKKLIKTYLMKTSEETIFKKEKCLHQEDCMKLVQKIVDGQATNQEIEDFKINMKSCMPCEKAFALETCLKETMQLRLEKKCVPISLLDCIKQKVAEL